MLPVGGRTKADIHGYIENSATYASNQFALCVWRALEMQSSHHAIGTHALVVLHEMYRSNFLLKLTLGE